MTVSTTATSVTGGKQTGAAKNTETDPVEKVECALQRRRAFTEIMVNVLGYCQEKRLLSEVEEEIASYPEFKYVDQSQASIVFMLVDAGGLRLINLDKSGHLIEESRLKTLDEDQVDELVCFYALETTAAGMEVANAHRPEIRLQSLFEQAPERNDVYREILAFCKQPRSFEEIASLSGGWPSFASMNTHSGLDLYPSALIAHLEDAGGLVWDEAWMTTPAGLSFSTQSEGDR